MKKNLLHFCVMVLALLCATPVMAQSDPDVVVNENFDAFDGGSVDAPLTTDISGYSGKLKQVLGWTSGRYVYEAGGSLKIGDGGNLQTSYLKLSTNGGNVKISFDVKALDSYGAGVKVSMGYSANTTQYIYDSDWHTVSVVFSGGTSSAYVKIEPVMSASGIVVDNLKIETSQGFVAAPKTAQPTVASKTSFEALWYGVSGNTGYKLDVYTKNGDAKDYLLQDKDVTGTYTSAYSPNKYKVEGLDETKTYYYVMRTKKGEYVSDNSEEFEVIPVITSIDVPTTQEAENVSATGFTAKWNAVENATGYMVKLVKKETLKEAAEVAVLSEDFSGITKGTMSAPEYIATNASLDDYTNVPGWTANNGCLAVGYMGLSPYGSGSYLMTPDLDLSANDGKFTLKFTACVNSYGTMVADDLTIVVYDKNGDVAKQQTFTMDAAWKEYTFDYECGDDNTTLKLVYEGSKKFYVDQLEIRQQLKAGDVVTSLVENADAGNVLEKTFNVTLDEYTSYEYSVAAYVYTIVSGEPGDLVSSYSAPVAVAVPTGIIETTVKADADASLYNVQGMQIAKPVRGQIYIKNGKKFIAR